MKVNQFVAGAALGAAALASSAAIAGTSGNVGVVSNYMFRGLDVSNDGAAVQGGMDHDFQLLKGLYGGLWVSNASVAGGNEADLYAGYGFTLGQFALDGGVIYYAYTEDTEGTALAPNGRNLDYAEVYIGGLIGPAAVKVFYAPEFRADAGGANGEENDGLMYVTASATLTLNETISFVPQIGFSAGDGAKGAFGDEYADFSITAIKKLKDDMSVSLAVIGTDRDEPRGAGTDDHPKLVVGFKKNFKIL